MTNKEHEQSHAHTAESKKDAAQGAPHAHSEVKHVKEVSEKPAVVKEKKHVKREIVTATSNNIGLSLKHGMAVSRFIKHKAIDVAIKDLEGVIKFKKIVPFSGEIPHRKGKGMMSGRYPITAAALFINTLKNLKGNCIVNGFDMERVRIATSSVNWASRPMRRGGRKGKRAHLTITAIEMKEKKHG